MTRNWIGGLLALVVMVASASGQTYCTPQSNGFLCSTDEYISNVTFDSINNTTACVASPGYEDFSTTVAPPLLAAGATYNISVTIGNYWATDIVGVFVDLNQNFSLDDAGEQLTTLTSTAAGSGTSPQVLTGTVTIPTTALTGITRLRLRLVYGTFPTTPACGLNTFGNTEDYSIQIATNLPPAWEVNGPGSSLALNGVQASAFTKATGQACTGSLVNVASGGTAGLGWDIAFNFAPTVSSTTAGSFVSGGGQIVNLDLTTGIYFLLGGTLPSLAPYPGGFAAAFAAPLPGTTAFQQVNIDPTNPEGASLSQACELVTVSLSLPPTPFAGPTADDSEVAVNVGCVRVFGTAFSTIYLESNGRLMFGGGTTTFTPTAAQFATDAPSIGVWCDMNPSLLVGGSTGLITLNNPSPGVIDVTYTNVAYYGTTIPNNYSIQLDTGTNALSIIGLNGLGIGTGQQMIGLSGGSAVTATDAGASNFSIGGLPSLGSTFNSTDMIYMLGTAGTLTTGITRIDFILNGFNNYDWISS